MSAPVYIHTPHTDALISDAYRGAVPIAKRARGLFTSARMDYATPRRLFLWLDAEFHFDCDVCASASNAVCDSYFDTDALNLPWRGVCWMNPPYGRKIARWVEKAYRSAASGVVCCHPGPTRNGGTTTA